jgi:hypothetical protein
MSLADLASLCEGTQDARVLKQIRAELAKRKTQGARRLETIIDQKLSKAPPSPDLFGHYAIPGPPTPRSAPARTTAGPQARRRAIPRKPKYPPTEEQMVSINAFISGDSLKITAFAGAGKTSTLVQMADLREGAGLYLAFNRAIADEAKSEFLSSVDCRTTHSVALRSVRAAGEYQQHKLFTVIKPKQLAKVLELKNRVVSGALSLSDVQQAHLFASTVR